MLFTSWHLEMSQLIYLHGLHVHILCKHPLHHTSDRGGHTRRAGQGF